jgi:hypothetical protein
MSEWFASGRVAPKPTPRSGKPLWRVRKDHRTVEALLRAHPDGLESGVEVQFYYNGDFVYRRRWTTREAALAEAGDRLRELQEKGWATHW